MNDPLSQLDENYHFKDGNIEVVPVEIVAKDPNSTSLAKSSSFIQYIIIPKKAEGKVSKDKLNKL